jgi:hypothetical protein
MKKTESKTKSKNEWALQSKNLPATQGMLHLVQNELKADIRGLRSEMDAGFHRVESSVAEVKASVARVEASTARIEALVEEQNSRNQVVLEGLTGLYHRQDRVESRLGEVENLVQTIAVHARR